MTQEPHAAHTRTESTEVHDASVSRPPATPAPGRFPTTRLVIAALMLLVPLIAYADTIHVDASATGSDDGTSWADAYTDLQDALGEAESGDEIWVAAGVYAPHSGEDRMATFELKNGVGIYGGFDGTEAERDQRDPQDNVTTLSGRFGSADSYHVVSAFETDGSAVLDGFTITDGLADAGDQLVGGGMVIVEASPTLTNLVFRGNSAEFRGGGLYNEGGGPTLTNVTFSYNDIINRFGGPQAGNGGGMFSLNGAPTLTDVTFHSNDADYGAGGLLISQGTATLTDVFFNDNHADNIGGGLFVSGADATLTNVNFEDNSAGNMGGGMYIEGGATPVLNNATFSDNSAERGGGIFNATGTYDLTDVVFSGNRAEDGSGGGVFNIGVHETTPTPTLTNVIFSANSASKDGGGIINDVSDAILTNVTFSGNSAGRNGGGSFTDFESSVDIRNTIFWNNQDSSGTDTASASIDFGDEDSGATISHSLVQGCNPDDNWNSDCGTDDGDNLPDADPLFVNTPDPDAAPTTAGDLRLQVDSGSPAIDVGNNTDNDTSTDLAGNVRIVNDTIDLGAYEIVAPSCPDDGMLFVDRDADQPGDGLSWASAFRNLHYALAVTEPCEVWVAEGVYKPTDSTARTVSFELADEVGLYGGFEGTETQRNERDPKTNITVLSGDVDDDDITDSDGVVADATDIAGGNSYNVVTGVGMDETAILDGFTVTAGNADSPDAPNDHGGGMRNRYGNPTLIDVVFSGNRAARGGGVSNINGSPILTGVTFSGNSVSNDGGGMHNEGGDPALTNVAFTGNNADSDGGGLYNYASNLVVTNGVFSGNNASEGGGMWNNSNFEIRNTVFWNNQDSSGIGTAAASIVPGGFANQSISYSLVQGCNPGGSWNTDCGTDGGNNLQDGDPLFVDTPDPSSAPTAAADVRLQARSPAVDAGNDGFFSDITTATDLDGNDRRFGDSVDLGPFETVYRLLDLETAGDGQGSVITEEPPRFAPDESVSVEAVPAQSSVFDGWTGDFTSADNPLDFTIDTDTALTAAFTLKNFEVTANASGSGTITPPSQSVDYDGTASFIVTPDTNWSVASVTGDTCNPANTTGTTWEAANIEADCAVEATFSIDSFKIGGTVSGLEGDGLELALNDNEILPIADNGAFQFNTEIDHDTEYAVTVDSQPDGQQCTVAQGTGTVAGDDVTSVEVDCSTIEIAIDNGELEFGTLTLPFGQQDPRSITISNAGDPDVVIERFDAPESPFTFDPGSCGPLPRTLAAGETCTVEVGMEPGLEGNFNDSLEIGSNAESSPDAVSLRGAVTAVPVPVLGPLGLLLLMVILGFAARTALQRN